VRAANHRFLRARSFQVWHEEDTPALLENSSLLSVCDPLSGSDLLQPVLVMKATEKSCEAGLDVLGRGPAVSVRRDTQRRGLI
jgi:hypothetical protein